MFPDFANLSSQWDSSAEYLAIYPNVLLRTHHDHAFAIILVPQGPKKTVENIRLYYSVSETTPDPRAKNTTQLTLVCQEDVFVAEGTQRGRHAKWKPNVRSAKPRSDGTTEHDCLKAHAEDYTLSFCAL